MPSIKYLIELSDQDRKKLEGIVKKGASPARTIMRANVLLASDRNGKKPMTVEEVSIAFHVSSTTIQKVRVEFAEQGLEVCLARKKRKIPPVCQSYGRSGSSYYRFGVCRSPGRIQSLDSTITYR